MQKKICSNCKMEKPHSEYYRDNKRKIGIRCKCKVCCNLDVLGWRDKNRSEYNNYVAEWRAKNPDKQHATEIKRNYGLRIEKYNEMLAAQACKCIICDAHHDPSLKRNRLHVDHNHSTGKVRGLLCGTCNSGIGYMKENAALLRKAAEYLES